MFDASDGTQPSAKILQFENYPAKPPNLDTWLVNAGSSC